MKNNRINPKEKKNRLLAVFNHSKGMTFIYLLLAGRFTKNYFIQYLRSFSFDCHGGHIWVPNQSGGS